MGNALKISVVLSLFMKQRIILRYVNAVRLALYGEGS